MTNSTQYFIRPYLLHAFKLLLFIIMSSCHSAVALGQSLPDESVSSIIDQPSIPLALQEFIQHLKKDSDSKNISVDNIKTLIYVIKQDLEKLDLAKISMYEQPSPALVKIANTLLFTVAGVAGACLYGILNDTVTARLCIEYFNSPAHPGHYNMMRRFGYEKPENETSPTTIALKFGVAATWWVGLPIGLGIAGASQLSNDLPSLYVSDVLPEAVNLFAIVGSSALISGIVGHILARMGIIWSPTAQKHLSSEQHIWFMTVGSAHNAAYLTGALGGLYIMFNLVKKRGLIAQQILYKQIYDLCIELEKMLDNLQPKAS